MSRLAKVVGNLPAYYSKDPQPVAALAVSFNLGATFSVKDLRFRSAVPQGSTAIDISLRTITLGQLATAIAAVSGYAASVLGGLSAVKAYTLIEGAYNGAGGVTVNIPYFTATNYQILAPIAESFDELDLDWGSALQQTDLRQSSGVWLDRLGQLYGVLRTAGESDLFYSRRINQSVIAAKTNGFGISSILQNALGVPAVVADTTPYSFTTTVTIQDSVGNPYNTTSINTLVNQYKAFGTIATLVIKLAGSESDLGGDDTDSLVDSLSTGTGEWGAPEWGAREAGA